MEIKPWLLITAALIISSSAFAEMRLWTDKDGKTIEAEFVRITGDKVVLKQVNEKELEVSLDTLSEQDRRFAILQAPPKIEIDVNTDVDRSNKGYGNYGAGYQVQKETISADVKVRKTSSNPYEAPLISEVFLIGQLEQQEHYIILNRSRSQFTFTGDNKREYVYSSGEVSLKQLEAGSQMGVEYRGYLAVVKDRAGNIVEIKSNKPGFEKNADVIMESQRGDTFDKEFKPLRRKATRKDMQDKMQRKRRIPGRTF